MSIVLPLGRSVQSYLRHFGYRSPRLRRRCPCCGAAHMHQHGRYWRCAVSRRRITRIPIYRWKCPACGRTLSLLPDFLKPYAQFVTLLREKAIWRRLAGWPWARVALAVSSTAVSVVSVRTLLRWWQRTLQWAGDRGTEPVGRLLEVAPAVDLGLFPPQGAGPADMVQGLRDAGRLLQAQVGRLPDSHPGLCAFLNSLLGGPPYL